METKNDVFAFLHILLVGHFGSYVCSKDTLCSDVRRWEVRACTVLAIYRVSDFVEYSLEFIDDQVAIMPDVCFAASFSKLNI